MNLTPVGQIYSEYYLRDINRVLKAEGGYVKNPNDPGGETKWGISKRSYPELDIPNLTRDDAIYIFHRDFYAPLEGKLGPKIIFQGLDFAVNSGVFTAISHLQKAVGAAPDGHWGEHSAACYAAMDPNDVNYLYISARLEFMTYCKNWKDAGAGWARRVAQDLRYAAEDN